MEVNMDKYAYITYVDNVIYVKGAAALQTCLAKVKSSHPFFVMVPKNREQKLDNELCRYNINTIEVDSAPVPFSFEDYVQRNILNRYYSFNKLNAANLTQFSKIILLDTDVYINKNIDHLFLKDNFTSVVAGKAAHPEWVDLCPGLIVLKPSESFYKSLISYIPECVAMTKLRGDDYYIGDFDVWASYDNYFWRDRSDLQLAEAYQCNAEDADVFVKSTKVNKKDIYTIHFGRKPKPWLRTRSEIFKRYIHLIVKRRFVEFYFLRKYLKVIKSL